MQERGYSGRTDSDLFEYFVRQGTTRRTGLRDGETASRRGTDGGRVAEQTDRAKSSGDSQSSQVDNNVRYFRTKDGEVFGFTDGEKIYLDTKKMKKDTPLHEYAHLWCDALRRGNPEEWEHVKSLFDSVEGLKERIKETYPELEGDALYEEMTGYNDKDQYFTFAIGKGSERMPSFKNSS